MLTLFEMTTQHGYIVSVLNEFVRALGRDLRLYRIEFVSAKPSNVRYMRMWYIPREDVQKEPHLTYRIPERDPLQSKDMWQRDVRAELIQIWKDAFGKGTQATSESEPSSPTPSSTSVQPASETSPSESDQGASESTDSAPLNQTPPSDTRTGHSSKGSKRPYTKRAKGSQSSSGASTANSTSATGRRASGQRGS